MQTVTVGRTVHYTLTAADATQINRRRTSGDSIRDRMQASPPMWPAGAQAHIGSLAQEGDMLPLIVTRVADGKGGAEVSGQVLLDGNDTLWVMFIKEGTTPGTWAWPPRV